MRREGARKNLPLSHAPAGLGTSTPGDDGGGLDQTMAVTASATPAGLDGGASLSSVVSLRPVWAHGQDCKPEPKLKLELEIRT